MKMSIQPTFHEDAIITCRACGTTFKTGSTLQNITMEVCNNCHPFYTGEQRFMDTQGRVERFSKRMEDAKKMQEAWKERKQKKKEKSEKSGKSLKELLGEL
jgi:large subunit ribosomal protein L31